MALFIDIKSKGFDKLGALRQGDPATRRDFGIAGLRTSGVMLSHGAYTKSTEETSKHLAA